MAAAVRRQRRRPRLADVVANEFIQFNKGVQNRHLTEMAGEDSDRFLAHYADLYDAFF